MTLVDAMEIASKKAGVVFDTAFVDLISDGVSSEDATIWAAVEAADEFDRVLENLTNQ